MGAVPFSPFLPGSVDMKYRTLGKTGIEVSEIGFGTWGIGGARPGMPAYGPVDDAESIRALEAAFDSGVTFYDTADLYGFGHSETLLGKVFSGRRSQVVIGTKGGLTDGGGGHDLSADYLENALARSLKRLRSDYVDLYLLHNPPRTLLCRRPDLFRFLSRLHRQGMIRAFGISAATPDDALLILESQPSVPVLQVNLNLFDMRALDNGLMGLCQSTGTAIIARSPLSLGFLTGKIEPHQQFCYQDHRHRFPTAQIRRWSAGVDEYRHAFADEPVATPAQNALRFCLAFNPVATVIPGMMTTDEVKENVVVSELRRISEQRLKGIIQTYRRTEFFSHGGTEL